MERLLTTKDAADILGIKQNSLEIWRCQGRGPRFVKLGGAVRYRPSDLEAYIQKHTRQTDQAN